MARNVYITSAEGNTGKSTVALGLLAALRRTGRNIGVFRPVSRTGGDSDYILDLLLDELGDHGPATDFVGVSHEDVHADPNAALTRIVAHYNALARQFDVVVILGSDYSDVSTPTELSYNARIAANLGAPVLLVLGGRQHDENPPADTHVFTGVARGPEEMALAAEIAIAELRDEHAHLLAVVANRVSPDRLTEIEAAIVGAVDDGTKVPVWCIPEDTVLVAPTLRALLDAMDGSLYRGDPELLDREALDVVVSAMSMENVLPRLVEGAAVIVAGDRSDVLLAVLMAHGSGTFPALSGMILTGGFPISPAIERLVSGLESDLPVITTRLNTFETVLRITRTRGRLAAESRRKRDLALSLFARHVDGDELLALVDAAHDEVVTPLMFEYRLLERARSDIRHIVLPEGDDDRILRAASILLQRQAARLTILGDTASVADRAERLGVDISGANIVSPHDPELVARFASVYAALRAHKGVTLERARETVTDVSYFGTMMVHLGLADGMVSGAAHTTAHTIRPAFEIIKTMLGVSIVSSVFLMCLEDRVLVYGDCAVNPNP
ncbi:MAG: phosphate acetyltransferase, partial [Chloroflexia bacterium]|nr:phosphate acetyltransferase [Chloroflexia bacterium]